MEETRTADTTAVVNGFRRILRALRLASVATQSRTGISAAQLFVLRHLTDADEMSVNELAAYTLTDRSSVAAVVERLVERGLAARFRSADDGRRAAIHITPAGRRLLRGAPAAPTQRLIAGLEELDTEEVRRLAMLMTRLVHTMNLDSAPATMLFEGDAADGAGDTDWEAS